MSAYLQAALGLIQIISWIMTKLDEEKRTKVVVALVAQDFMRREKEILDRAQRARASVPVTPVDGVLPDDGFKLP